MPTELLERRPDIAQAERQVAAANAEIGVQVAGYFPQFTLTSQPAWRRLSSRSSSRAELPLVRRACPRADHFRRRGHTWPRAGGAGQLRRHGRQLSRHRAHRHPAGGGRPFGLRILEAEAVAEDRAVKSAILSLDVSTNQYKSGIVDYLTVITAQTTALDDEVQAVNIRTRRMTTSVLLVEALGGGWDKSKLPGRAGVADVPQAQRQIEKGKKSP